MKIKTNVMIIIFLTIVFMIGGHLLDIGDVFNDFNKRTKWLIQENQLWGKYGIGEPITTNGFWSNSANITYHSGYYLMYLAFFVIVILYINLLFKKNG